MSYYVYDSPIMYVINHGLSARKHWPAGRAHKHCRGNNNTKPGIDDGPSSPTARLPDSACRFLLIYPAFLPPSSSSFVHNSGIGWPLYVFTIRTEQYCYTNPIVLLYSFWFLFPPLSGKTQMQSTIDISETSTHTITL